MSELKSRTLKKRLVLKTYVRILYLRSLFLNLKPGLTEIFFGVNGV